jgi:hypothetical protein
MMTDMPTPAAPFVLPTAPQLAKPPAFWMIGAILVAAIAGNSLAAANAREAAAKAAIAAEAAARLADSVALAAKVADGTGLSAPLSMLLDSTVHSAPFPVPHELVHDHAVSARLDSASKLLRRAGASEELLLSSKQILAWVVDPLTPVQAQRLARLRASAATIGQQQAARSQRAGRNAPR